MSVRINHMLTQRNKANEEDDSMGAGVGVGKHWYLHHSNISFQHLMRNEPHENTLLCVWSIKY